MFAYAIVYFLEGIGDNLTAEQASEIQEIAALPEVARDYIAQRTNQARGISGPPSPPKSSRYGREQRALVMCATTPMTPKLLEDIWFDLDVLEYPKSVLLVMPSVLLHRDIIALAHLDETLAGGLRKKLLVLQKVSNNKPYVLPVMMDAIRSLVLSDPAAAAVIDVETIIVNLTNTLPQQTIDLNLEIATAQMAGFPYESYYGSRPAVGYAALLDLIARLGKDQQPLLVSLLDELKRPWVHQKLPPLAVSPWKTFLQLQVMLLCVEQVQLQPAMAKGLLDEFLGLLTVEPLPRYRYLLDWLCIRLITRHRLHSVVLQALRSRDHESKPKGLAHLMKLGCNLACSTEPFNSEAEAEAFALQLAVAFVPLAGSSKIVIRHEAQWQFHPSWTTHGFMGFNRF